MKAFRWIALAVCTTGACLRAQGKKEPSAAARLFERWRGNLVIVSAGKVGGSGFICEMAGQAYVVSCAHVLESGDDPSCRLLDGTDLSWQKVEFAEEADLVRLRLKDPWQGKKHALRTDAPRMEEPVVVVGNNQGLGVATAETGKVVGIGPGVVEVAIEIVGGVSGAPILDAEGAVLAVASHASVPRLLDPLAQGTRFGRSRRFGLLLAGRKWTEVAWADYADQARKLAGFEFLVKRDLGMLLFHALDRQSRGKRAMAMLPYQADTGSARSGDPVLRKSIASLYAAEGRLRGLQERLGARTARADSGEAWRTLTEQRDTTLRQCLGEIGDALATTRWASPLRKRSAGLAERVKALSKEAEKVIARDQAQFAASAAKAQDRAPATPANEIPVATAPVLTVPAPGALLPQIEKPWVFEWQAVAGATHYELLVTHPAGFRPWLHPIVSEAKYTRHPPPRKGGYLSLTKGWVWKVRAKQRDGGWGPWSAERRFDVEPRKVD